MVDDKYLWIFAPWTYFHSSKSPCFSAVVSYHPWSHAPEMSIWDTVKTRLSQNNNNGCHKNQEWIIIMNVNIYCIHVHDPTCPNSSSSPNKLLVESTCHSSTKALSAHVDQLRLHQVCRGQPLGLGLQCRSAASVLQGHGLQRQGIMKGTCHERRT